MQRGLSFRCIWGNNWSWLSSARSFLCSFWDSKWSTDCSDRWESVSTKSWWYRNGISSKKQVIMEYTGFVMGDTCDGHNLFVHTNMKQWVREGYFWSKIDIQKEIKCVEESWLWYLIPRYYVVEKVLVVCLMLHKNMLSEMEPLELDVHVGCGRPLFFDWGGMIDTLM